VQRVDNLDFKLHNFELSNFSLRFCLLHIKWVGYHHNIVPSQVRNRPYDLQQLGSWAAVKNMLNKQICIVDSWGGEVEYRMVVAVQNPSDSECI
jgi:hypothetical protein